METAASSPIAITQESLKLFGTLVNTSNRSFLEVDSSLPWVDGVDKSIMPKRAEHAWIYGTKYWDMLTDDQRSELLWLETGRDITAFIKLERFLPVLYVGYINKYQNALPKEIYDYLMIFSKEEIVHTLIFKKYMKMAELPMIVDPESPYQAFIGVVNDLPPIYGIFFTLIVEWAAELNAMYITQHEDAEPFTKRMMRAHHVEEVRHIAFGKRIVEAHFANATPEEHESLVKLFSSIVSGVYSEITYNRMIGEYTSFKFPISKDDKDAISEVRNSDHNRALNVLRFSEMNDWLATLGIK
jgi:hypothetical protein